MLSPGYTHSPTCACCFLDCQKYVRAVQISYGHFILQFFLSRFLGSLLFASTVIILSVSWETDQLPLIFPKTHLGKRSFALTSSKSSQIRQPCKWDQADRSYNGNSLVKRVCSGSDPSGSCEAAGFHCQCGLLADKSTVGLEMEEWKQCKLKRHKVYCSYQDSASFLE